MAVTAEEVAVGRDLGEGFAEVVTVTDYTDDDAVLDAARAAARRHRPRAILALAEVDVERAALLRGEFGLPGLDTVCCDGLPRQDRDEGVRTRGGDYAFRTSRQ